jgi:phosphoadenosine phosphosulfate reductase
MDSLGGRIIEPVETLVARYGHLAGEALLRPLIASELRGRVALVSSFGADAAVLLHMVASIDRATPVIFLDTGKHFGETLRYRDALVGSLGLTDVRSVVPDAGAVERNDPSGTLWHRDPARCCAVRKVAPLARALEPFTAWITGRKRFQGGERGALPTLEIAEGRLKINPLARWSAADITAEFAKRGLPPHPLVADGFLSIGCMPCTARAAAAGDPRSGRWLGLDKTECGIHHDFKDIAAGI